MHEYGPLKVEYGSILTKQGNMIDNMCIIIDMEAGTLLKYGEFGNGMEKYFELLSDGISDNIIIIHFDRYSDFSMDDTCSLVNYLLNVSGQAGRIFSLKNEELMDEVKRIQNLGY